MKHKKLCIPFTLAFCTYLCANPSYWGGTGLIRTPSARLIDDGEMRLTISYSYPYMHYAGSFGFFPFLELNGRVVEFRDEEVSNQGWSGYGYNRDKVADMKVLLLREQGLLPAIAAGIQDIQGNQLFFNEYLAANKKFGDFDLSIGYGGSLFGNIIKTEGAEVRELDGFFGGVKWDIREDISLMVEYDPTKELALNKGSVSTPLNYGINYNPWQWLTCGYSYQRGEQHSFMVSMRYPFGKQIATQQPDTPFFGPVDWSTLHRSMARASLAERLEKIRNFLAEEGFIDAQVTVSDDFKTLYIEFENTIYLSHNKAAGRVLRVAAAQTPSDIDNIRLIIKQQSIPMAEITLSREDLIAFLNQQLTEDEIKKKTGISSEISNKAVWWDAEYMKGAGRHPALSHKFELLQLETFLNDPSGFLRARAGPSLWMQRKLSKGLIAETFLRFPVYSNVKTNRDPISDNPVRSDVHEYLQNKGLVVENLFINKFWKLGPNNYLKLSGGYLELMYAGINAEYLRTFKDGRFAIGREATWAKKRTPGSPFGLQGKPSLTRFFNFYMYVPELETTFSAKAGEFLAEDKGIRFQVSRDMRGGQVYLWYTRTDTSHLTGNNRGYSDKGVGFLIPVRVFADSDMQGSNKIEASPWSRDVGQSVAQPYSLYDFVRELTPSYIMNNWAEINK